MMPSSAIHKPPAATPTLVISIDGLNASFLGPYGNTWFPTPCFNRLAAQSLMLEAAFTHELDPASFLYQTWSQWRQQLPEMGIALASDSDPVLNADWPGDWVPANLDVSVRASRIASRLERTHAARVAQKSLAWLADQPSGGVNWLHWSGLVGPWDAPRELRAALCDEDGPDSTDWTCAEDASAALSTAEEIDDWRFQLQTTYAAQVQCWDYALALVMDELQPRLASHELQLVVLAPRGFCVGTHGSCGDFESLWDEVWQVPVFIVQGEQVAATRSQRLSSLSELGLVLAETQMPASLWRDDSWLCCRNRIDVPGPERLAIQSQSTQAIKTREWTLRCPRRGGPELYVRPDDRFQVNDVADRVPEVVVELQQSVRQELGGEATDS
ncbi:MAG: hypothetical protein R3B96_01150 [Pirellulaceae bacterium]